MSSLRFCDILDSPNTIFQGKSLKSQNGLYSLTMQDDGNLVLYEHGNQPVWSSNTWRVGVPPYKLRMQHDGNCVLYDANNTPTWATNTWKQGVWGRFNLVLQNDRDFVLKDASGTITWSSGTKIAGEWNKSEPNVLASPHGLKEGCEIKSLNGIYSLVMQDDGNLVLYEKGGQPVWCSNTWRVGRSPYELKMQQDGNAVIYDGAGVAIWASNTWRPASNKSYKLSLLDNKGLVLTDSTGKVLWKACTETTGVTEQEPEQVHESGTQFTDNTFPASQQSIGPMDIIGGITWKRSTDILGDDWQMFCDGISSDDIEQGSLGDCWFLSAIAGVCKRPVLIEYLFETKKRNEQGKYIVNLCVGGSWTQVVIDDFFPVKHGKPIFTHNNSAELWVMALEKAYAKVCGSYSKLIGGDSCEAFQVITGCPTYSFSLENEDPTTLWKTMVNKLNNGYVACTGTKSSINENMGLFRSHAYSMLGCKEGHGVKLVKLRNPWGHGEWNGSWSDSDKIWTDQLKKYFGNEGCADDGDFFMTFEDYLKYFGDSSFCYCNTNLKRYEILFPGPAKSEELVDTNTYSYVKIDLKQDQDDAYFCIHQKNQRQEGKTELLAGAGFVIIQESTMKVVGGIPVDTKSDYTPALTLKAGVYYLVPIIHSRRTITTFPISYHIKGVSHHQIITNSCVQINGAHMSLLDLYALGIKECGSFSTYSGNWGFSYAGHGNERSVKVTPEISSKNLFWAYKPAEVPIQNNSTKCTAIGYKDVQGLGVSCNYGLKLIAYK